MGKLISLMDKCPKQVRYQLIRGLSGRKQAGVSLVVGEFYTMFEEDCEDFPELLLNACKLALYAKRTKNRAN